MMERDSGIDCVLLGYHELDFRSLADQQRRMADRNGFYSYLRTNSVLLDGARVPYSELLNRVIASATGRPSRLNVFDLPNLAVCYLASFLRRRGFGVEMVNFFNHDQ